MGRNFIKAFNGQVFAVGQMLVFDFHGVNLKGVVRGVSLLEMAAPGSAGPGKGGSFGILMEKTDVTLIKAGDSHIKIKGSSKK